MSEMIERVARALATAEGENPNSTWMFYENKSRAAVEAMREPTEEMKAAFDKDVDDWFDHQIHDDHHLYKCMIDAALKETV